MRCGVDANKTTGMSKNKRAVHVATIKKHHNGKTYVTHLLRRTFREGGKVKHVTIGILSDLPDDLIEVIRRRLAGDPLPAEDCGFRIVCGGLDGAMRAVCRGAHQSDAYREGMTVGIIPSSREESANRFVDVVIPTGMGHLRNALVAQSSAMVAIGGGAGTLSEMALAWVHRRPIFAAEVDGWSGEMAGRALDDRREDDPWLSTIHGVATPESAASQLADWREERSGE